MRGTTALAAGRPSVAGNWTGQGNDAVACVP
jgi:hypothetical protein